MSSNDFTDDRDIDPFMIGVVGIGGKPGLLKNRDNHIFQVIITLTGAITVIALAFFAYPPIRKKIL